MTHLSFIWMQCGKKSNVLIFKKYKHRGKAEILGQKHLQRVGESFPAYAGVTAGRFGIGCLREHL